MSAFLRTLLASIVASTLSLSAIAEEAKPFADDREVHLVDLLPPPPPNDSAETKAELAEVLTVQVTRTSAMEKEAIADDEENVWRFADAVDNPKFTKENLPKLTAFFDRVVETEAAVVDPAKKVWGRPRPHIYSNLVHPVVELSKSGAYPSGHTTLGTMMGIILADMIPEKRAALMTRGWDYGHNRLVAGIHFPKDIEAGRIAGTVTVQAIETHDDYKAEFEAARTELRAALGLPKMPTATN